MRKPGDAEGHAHVTPEKDPVKTKEGLRLFSPDRATTWDVGCLLGAALGHATEQPEDPMGETEPAAEHTPGAACTSPRSARFPTRILACGTAFSFPVEARIHRECVAEDMAV